MIVYKTGDILQSDADYIVIPVNCVGVPGAGLARQAAIKWPRAMARYKRACENTRVFPGDIGEIAIADGQAIIPLTTKDHWGSPSQLEWVRRGMKLMRLSYLYHNVCIAIPPLGCGLGGLNWSDVEGLIWETFSDKQAPGITAYVYPPQKEFEGR